MKFIKKEDIKLPKRREYSHKGDNGRVLIVGGSEDYIGAVALAGLAALRSGSDIVKIIAPEKVAWAINTYSPDLITKKLHSEIFLPNHFKIIKKEMEKFDILLIGNGIGLKESTKNFCKKTIKGIKKLKVIDADAIKSISMNYVENSIITPHLKELEFFLVNSKCNKTIIKNIFEKRLDDFFNFTMNIKNLTQKFLEKNNVIILKGRIDAIISKDKVFYNKTGNAGMTKAGTGDVLAGLCAGFLSQSMNLVQSAINAAYFNGLIGDILLKNKKGFTYLASDMVNEIKILNQNIEIRNPKQ